MGKRRARRGFALAACMVPRKRAGVKAGMFERAPFAVCWAAKLAKAFDSRRR